jgi:type II secretion system protein H
MCSRSRHSGFSLIEIMVVMVLMAVVAAAIIPEMRGTYADAVLRSTARKMASALTMASSQAVTFGKPHRVRLDAVQHRYRIEPVGPSSGKDARGIAPRRPPQEGELDSRVSIVVRPTAVEDDVPTGVKPGTTPADGTRDHAGRGITFYPDGTADGVEIRLQVGEGGGMALLVNPVTSRVRIVTELKP